MQQLSRRANSLAHLDSKSQGLFLVSSGLATAPPPSAQAQRRGPGPLPEPAYSVLSCRSRQSLGSKLKA